LWSNPPWVASKKEPEALISAPESQEARFITPLLRHFIVFWREIVALTEGDNAPIPITFLCTACQDESNSSK